MDREIGVFRIMIYPSYAIASKIKTDLQDNSSKIPNSTLITSLVAPCGKDKPNVVVCIDYDGGAYSDRLNIDEAYIQIMVRNARNKQSWDDCAAIKEHLQAIEPFRYTLNTDWIDFKGIYIQSGPSFRQDEEKNRIWSFNIRAIIENKEAGNRL